MSDLKKTDKPESASAHPTSHVNQPHAPSSDPVKLHPTASPAPVQPKAFEPPAPPVVKVSLEEQMDQQRKLIDDLTTRKLAAQEKLDALIGQHNRLVK